jgi:hypothetical protein
MKPSANAAKISKATTVIAVIEGPSFKARPPAWLLMVTESFLRGWVLAVVVAGLAIGS